jgi:hypothetical protein
MNQHQPSPIHASAAQPEHQKKRTNPLHKYRFQCQQKYPLTCYLSYLINWLKYGINIILLAILAIAMNTLHF